MFLCVNYINQYENPAGGKNYYEVKNPFSTFLLKIFRVCFQNQVHLLDPSELLRPEPTFADKNPSKFRDYSVDTEDPLKERVRRTYRQMHLNQTVDFVKGM